MAKQIFQAIELDHGIETILPCLEAGDRPSFLAKVMRIIKKLAVHFHGWQRRQTGESFIPRESHERESRLEFERFVHW